MSKSSSKLSTRLWSNADLDSEDEFLLEKQPEQKSINVFMFALRKRWYQYINNYFAPYVSVAVLCVFFTLVFVYMSRFSSTGRKNIDSNTD